MHSTSTPRSSSIRALDFLALASRLARPQWTQFGTASMILGLMVMALALAAQARGAWAASAPRKLERGARLWIAMGQSNPVLTVGAAVCAAVPVLGIFSFFYLLREGG